MSPIILFCHLYIETVTQLASDPNPDVHLLHGIQHKVALIYLLLFLLIHHRVSNNLIRESLIYLSYLLETLRLLKGNLISLYSFFLFSFYFVDPFSVIQHFFRHNELLTHFLEVSAGYLHCDVSRQISVACCF